MRFTCSEIEGFNLEKDWDDGPLYAALETQVELPKLSKNPSLSDYEFSRIDHSEYLWKIMVLHEVNLNIKCLSFEWSLEKITDSDIKDMGFP